MGDFELLALLDAVGTFPISPEDAFGGAGSAAWEQARLLDPDAFGERGTWRLAFRSYAVLGPDGGVTLIDLGVGSQSSLASSWAPTPGALPDCLVRAGVDRWEVDTVVLTHLHSDHVGWAVDRSGDVLFPRARHVLQQRELDASRDQPVWNHVIQPLLDHGLLEPIDGTSLLSASGGDRIELIPTPGHTPGHQSVAIKSQGETALVTGDVFVHAVQIADPDVSYLYEDSYELAADTRRRVLRDAAAVSATIASPHLMTPYLRSIASRTSNGS